MKVKLIFDSDLSWHAQKIIDVQDNVSTKDIEAMFPIELGVTYNEHDCRYEALDGRHIYTLKEVLAYSE